MASSLLRHVDIGKIVDGLCTDPEDNEEVRLQKRILLRASLMFILAGVAWGSMYIYFGEPFSGLIPLGYSVISSASVITFAITRRYHFFRYSQLLLILLLPFLLMVALGGFINSSAVILWSFLSPLGALLFDEPRRAPRWALAFFGLVILSILIHPYISDENNLPSWLVTTFFGVNILGVSLIAFGLLYYFVDQKDLAFGLLRVEQEKAHTLLLNVLPKEIAAILKDEKRTIADQYEGASILFADLVGFTPMSAELAPNEMVELLNEIFSHFDALVEKYDLEKIRTIGDNYMVAAGVPRPRPDHANAITHLAVEMRDFVERFPPRKGKKIAFRIGINSGPVVGGVIGRKKFVFDLWGDAVNVASRMESQGKPGEIQVTSRTYELIRDEFSCIPRGALDIKGRGEMDTWFVTGVRQARAARSHPAQKLPA